MTTLANSLALRDQLAVSPPQPEPITEVRTFPAVVRQQPALPPAAGNVYPAPEARIPRFNVAFTLRDYGGWSGEWTGSHGVIARPSAGSAQRGPQEPWDQQRRTLRSAPREAWDAGTAIGRGL